MATRTDNAKSDDRLANGRTNGAGNVPDGLQRALEHEPGAPGDTLALPEGDNIPGVEVDQSASAAPSWREEWSIHRRLLAAQAAVSVLTKDVDVKRNESKSTGKTYGGYKAISGDQVVAVGRATLIEHGILFEPDMDKESSKKDGNKTLVWINAVLRNVDDPEDCKAYGAWGEGVDMAAHGHQKAYTNGVKQILSKALLLTTVGDEATDGKEPEHVPAGDSSKAREAKAETENTIRAWADNFKVALDSCESIDELEEVRSSNAHMLKSANLPEKTREYFKDRITHLEEILS